MPRPLVARETPTSCILCIGEITTGSFGMFLQRYIMLHINIQDFPLQVSWKTCGEATHPIRYILVFLPFVRKAAWSECYFLLLPACSTTTALWSQISWAHVSSTSRDNRLPAPSDWAQSPGMCWAAYIHIVILLSAAVLLLFCRLCHKPEVWRHLPPASVPLTIATHLPATEWQTPFNLGEYVLSLIFKFQLFVFAPLHVRARESRSATNLTVTSSSCPNSSKFHNNQ